MVPAIAPPKPSAAPRPRRRLQHGPERDALARSLPRAAVRGRRGRGQGAGRGVEGGAWRAPSEWREGLGLRGRGPTGGAWPLTKGLDGRAG